MERERSRSAACAAGPEGYERMNRRQNEIYVFYRFFAHCENSFFHRFFCYVCLSFFFFRGKPTTPHGGPPCSVDRFSLDSWCWGGGWKITTVATIHCAFETCIQHVQDIASGCSRDSCLIQRGNAWVLEGYLSDEHCL